MTTVIAFMHYGDMVGCSFGSRFPTEEICATTLGQVLEAGPCKLNFFPASPASVSTTTDRSKIIL